MAKKKPGNRTPTNEQTLDMIRKAAAKSAAKASEVAAQLELSLVHFREKDLDIAFNFDISKETIWATQAQMAELFGREVSTINEHIKTVLREGELSEDSVIRKFPITAGDGKTYDTNHYNLDMVLSVGYRVSSTKATKFRQWATQTLKAYLTDGFVINEKRMSEDSRALGKLAATVRKIRSDEKNIFRAVRDCFAAMASDYDHASPAARHFFARLQDKFVYAVNEKTSAQVVLERADGRKPVMGMTSLDRMPTAKDAVVGKNYLDSDELYAMHIICEQFLLFVETKAIRGQAMTMIELGQKFNDLLEVSDYPVFPGYGDPLRGEANEHALAELELFRDGVRRGELPKPSAG